MKSVSVVCNSVDSRTYVTEKRKCRRKLTVIDKLKKIVENKMKLSLNMLIDFQIIIFFFFSLDW